MNSDAPEDGGDPLTSAKGIPSLPQVPSFTIEGMVRGLVLRDSERAGPYARIRLASDLGYLFDFDDPDSWEGLRGCRVRVECIEQLGEDGYTYRVVLNAEVLR
jgi:hypothetical protein